MSTQPNLVDEVEASFQNCISLLTSQEHFNTPGDPEEIKSSMDQCIQKFLEATRQLDCFFIQKRLQVSAARPELTGKEDISQLKAELERKNALIQKHSERLQQWLAVHSPSTTGMGGSPTGQTAAAATASASAMGIPQPGPSQAIPPPLAGVPAMPGSSQGMPGTSQGPVMSASSQGPLAFLEQTTSNIGSLPRGMGGSV